MLDLSVTYIKVEDTTPSYDELEVVCVDVVCLEVRDSVTVSVITILPHQD